MSDTKMLARVRALLAKAESTDSGPEAEALIGKAQELMARYSIDQAMLADAAPAGAFNKQTVFVPNPYSLPKVLLLSAIVKANNGHTVRRTFRGGNQVDVFIHDDDWNAVETLWTALEMHAVRDMTNAEVPWYDHARSFRSSFLKAFALRIGARLKQAKAQAQRDAETQHGTGVALVLADRSKRALALRDEAYPRLRNGGRTTLTSGAGVRAGQRSADGASLGQSQVRGARAALR